VRITEGDAECPIDVCTSKYLASGLQQNVHRLAQDMVIYPEVLARCHASSRTWAWSRGMQEGDEDGRSAWALRAAGGGCRENGGWRDQGESGVALAAILI
jgi:hypothetical protein